jgi:hypothetical protein
MKKLIIFPSAFILMCSCSEKEKKISAAELPSKVSASFNAKYPDASDVKWEEEMENGKTVYEADFKLHGNGIEVEIDTAGIVVKEELDSASKATH